MTVFGALEELRQRPIAGQAQARAARQDYRRRIPIARDNAGSRLNVNADTAAGAVAAAMKAEKLVVVSDTHGIRSDPKNPESRCPHLTVNGIQEMVKTGAISAGMLPKVEACITALQAGVGKAHIIDGRIPHSLLLEIYTQAGIGTEIVL